MIRLYMQKIAAIPCTDACSMYEFIVLSFVIIEHTILHIIVAKVKLYKTAAKKGISSYRELVQYNAERI